MTWTTLRWVWRLEAPLFIGMPPAGALNRCRLYIPALAMHGAVTAELARLNGNGNSKFPDYGKFGCEVGENCRFTYLYPTEKVNGSYLAWLPKFEQPRGLIWRRQNGKEKATDREFRRRLLDSRPGTAITPETDSASEGTLRETECINSWWHSPADNDKEASSVYFMGYIFLKNNFCNGNSYENTSGKKQVRLRDIQTLYVGGDTRYGFGKICRVDDLSENKTVFGGSVCDLDKENPEIQSDIVFGHALENGQTPIQGMQGMKELLGGWEINKTRTPKLGWIPGSSLERSATWSIDNYGYWTKGNPT